MRLQHAVKPISYVKTHAAELIRAIGETGLPVVITQNGQATAVLLGIGEYERTQESLALLKILALGQKDLEEGRVKPMGEAFAGIRKRAALRRQQP